MNVSQSLMLLTLSAVSATAEVGDMEEIQSFQNRTFILTNLHNLVHAGDTVIRNMHSPGHATRKKSKKWQSGQQVSNEQSPPIFFIALRVILADIFDIVEPDITIVDIVETPCKGTVYR